MSGSFTCLIAAKYILPNWLMWKVISKLLLCLSLIKSFSQGGNPGLVVEGEGLIAVCCEFKSQHRVLDGHFFTYLCCKVCLKRLKINCKEDGPYLKNRSRLCGQCDQIGPFLKLLGAKIFYKSIPNIECHFGLLWKHHF